MTSDVVISQKQRHHHCKVASAAALVGDAVGSTEMRISSDAVTHPTLVDLGCSDARSTQI